MNRLLVPLALTALVLPATVHAQTDARAVGDEIMGHFESSTRKVARLARAMPEEVWGWSPGEGVMTVVHVYAHIARYNFMYLEDNLGIRAPEGVEVETMESITDRAEVLALLDQSVEHVRTAVARMSAEDLDETTTLYGRQVPKWAVLTQLVAHMNEHLGQSIAYARMNGITPPWSG